MSKKWPPDIIKPYAFQKGEIATIVKECKERGKRGEALVNCIFTTIKRLRKGKNLKQIIEIREKLKKGIKPSLLGS